MYGYRGKILRIDLSSNTFSVEKLDENLAKKFIGGRGLVMSMRWTQKLKR